MPKAKAPKPGAVRKAQEATRTTRITLRGRTLEFTNVALKEKIAVRYATGMPLEAFWSGEGRIGEDSVSVLWWIARRANGEPGLSFEQHLQEWPDDLTAGDLEVEIIEDDGEPTSDPEGSGPA